MAGLGLQSVDRLASRTGVAFGYISNSAQSITLLESRFNSSDFSETAADPPNVNLPADLRFSWVEIRNDGPGRIFVDFAQTTQDNTSPAPYVEAGERVLFQGLSPLGQNAGVKNIQLVMYAPVPEEAFPADNPSVIVRGRVYLRAGFLSVHQSA